METYVMKSIRYGLLAGAALVAGAGIALAQMAAPPPAPDMYGPGPMHGRLAERLLKDFDLNHDGKITKAELDKALAQRFAEATGGGAKMTEDQFEKSHEKMLRQHTDKMFHSIDWNGDGVLSLDEFRAPLRTRFAMMDRDGKGEISCKPAEGQQNAPAGTQPGMGSGKMHFMHRHGMSFRGGLMRLCQEADLNKDGKVTRAEADKAIADKYAAAVRGGKGMTPDEFYVLELVRFKDMEARRFKRLDTDNDGTLSEAEFASAGQKMFAHLDQNHDGVVTKDELSSPHRGHRDRGKKPG